MKKMLTAFTGALVLLVCVSATALAAPPAVPETPLATASGQPDTAPYTTYGYYIVYDGDRIHLRTTDIDNGNGASEYTGVITANGPIRDERLLKAEDDDSAVVSGNKLDFRFRTYNGTDGVSFTAHDATRITFHLYRNGHLIETEHVFLGAARVNPPGNPFTLVV